MILKFDGRDVEKVKALFSVARFASAASLGKCDRIMGDDSKVRIEDRGM